MNRAARPSSFSAALSMGLVAVALGASGCAGVDVTIRQPLIVNTVDQNTIVKQHGYSENNHGLPRGTMTDIATLTRLGQKDICFDVTLHEFDQINFAEVRAKLTADGRVQEQAQLWPEQPLVKNYNGLVTQRVPYGSETFCSARDVYGNCVAWASRPSYTYVTQPGQVEVYETRGRMCFPNDGFVVPTTHTLRLDLVLPRPTAAPTATYVMGFGVYGAREKRSVFRWGFVGGGKK